MEELIIKNEFGPKKAWYEKNTEIETGRVL